MVGHQHRLTLEHYMPHRNHRLTDLDIEGDCKDTSSKKYEFKKPTKDSEKKDDNTPESTSSSSSTSATASPSSEEKSTQE